MKQIGSFDTIVGYFRQLLESLPDKRTGKNSRYGMEDAALSAFSVFFTQSPSFLSYQRTMEQTKGRSNAQSLFGVHKIPTDNHIRDLLDPVKPEEIFPVFETILETIEQKAKLQGFRAFANNLLMAIDGNDKQDCENTAAKRWLLQHGNKYSSLKVTVLGDDLYCHQPLCQMLLDQEFNFILVCRPESHPTMYEHLEGISLPTVVVKKWTGKFEETHTYRYLNGLPIKDGEDALLVNWCELTVTRPDGKVVYKNSFATNHTITDQTVVEIVLAGRTRWKVENENNNTLKTKGYNLEHNFGHGKEHLASFLTTLNILSLLFHTLLELVDDKYKLLRSHLPTRKTFFNDLRALTRYLVFDSWEHLLTFMIQGLELDLPPNSS